MKEYLVLYRRSFGEVLYRAEGEKLAVSRVNENSAACRQMSSYLLLVYLTARKIKPLKEGGESYPLARKKSLGRNERGPSLLGGKSLYLGKLFAIGKREASRSRPQKRCHNTAATETVAYVGAKGAYISSRGHRRRKLVITVRAVRFLARDRINKDRSSDSFYLLALARIFVKLFSAYLDSRIHRRYLLALSKEGEGGFFYLLVRGKRVGA